MSSSTSSPSTIHQNVVPSEVGWQFVPQYYTFVNKEPSRLHCFYTKASTFVHGNEGEDSKPCYGQQEIHQKITSIGFEDCKVFIHSVDAQASANGGIIIQVIGEMSNRGETWRKFVQTFFLAEQPNGYFVLNDIFRFLKEESVEGDGDDLSETEVESVVESEPAPVEAKPAREPTPPPAVPAAPSPPPAFATTSEEAPTTDIPDAAPEAVTPAPEPQPTAEPAPAQPNGIHVVPEVEKPAPIIEKPAAPPAPASVTPSTSTSAPTPAVSAPQQPAAPIPAPVPSAPRSWAALAASNTKKWGSAVAQESRGTTETPASPAPSSGTQTPATSHPGRGPANRSEHSLHQQAQGVSTAQCFIKGVVEGITPPALGQLLSARFGPYKDLEIVRTRGCAFLEFISIESAKKAITASLNQNQGGEGGVFIDVGGEQVRIFIETKKERGDRPPVRGRGGAPPMNGDGRGQGNYRGRGSGRGRGGPPAGK